MSGLSINMTEAEREDFMARLMAKDAIAMKNALVEANKSDEDYILDHVTTEFVKNFDSALSKVEGHEGAVGGDDFKATMRSWFAYARNAYIDD